mgnify:CR=1 FL=1
MIFSLFVIILTGVFDLTSWLLVLVDFNTSFFNLRVCLSVTIFFEPLQEVSEIDKIIRAKGSHNLKLIIFFFGAEDS